MPILPRPRAVLIPSLVALAVLLPGAAAAQAASPWRLTDPMSADRPDATVAPLPDGDVLVTGGGSWFTGELLSAERWDALTGTWSATAPPPVATSGAAAVPLSDGRVLLAGGGVYAGQVRSATIFDAAAGSWTPVSPMAATRSKAAAARLADGRVLIVGGDSPASSELYDPADDSWTTLPAPPRRSEGYGGSLVSLPDGSAVLVGGCIWSPMTPDCRSDDVSRLDPVSGTWTALPALPERIGGFAAARLDDGALVVVGGHDQTNAPLETTWVLDPGAAAWRSGAAIPPLPDAASAQLPGGLLLVASAARAVIVDLTTGRVAPAGTPSGFPTTPGASPLVGMPSAGGAFFGGGGPFQAMRLPWFSGQVGLSAPPADFGEQTTGRRAAVVTVPIAPAGELPLIVRGVTVEGADAADFTVATDGCTGKGLTGDAVCFVTVRFTPGADGPRSASLRIAAPLLEGDGLIALTGEGVPAPIIPPTTPPTTPTPTNPQPPATPQPPTPPGGGTARRRATAEPRIRRVARNVVCTGLPRSLGRGSVRLSRGGIVHATGTLANGRLTLKVRRRLFDRRCTLVIGGRKSVKVVLD